MWNIENFDTDKSCFYYLCGMTAQIPENFTADISLKDFFMREIPLKPDWQGEVKAVLVYKPAPEPAQKAILYLHGFIDYFYQRDMALFFNDLGYNFYALDLRKYGRALMPHQKPNIIKAMEDYYEEIDKAVDIIKNEHGNDFLILKGHSTGGLLASLYAEDHKEDVDALILNSPFFEFNISAGKRFALLPLIKLLHGIMPEFGIDSLTEVHPKSMHKDYFGEWDFNTDWKPIENFPAFFAWLHAIREGHKRIHNGLNIKCPVLVMYSDKSFKGKKFAPEALKADAVLDPEHIAKYASYLGKNVTKLEVKDGMHDLVLSGKEAREKVYEEMKNWLVSVE